jgi:hypothetical protein
MDKKLKDNLDYVKSEYKKLANFDLAMIFMITFTLWASMMNLYWLSYGSLMLCVVFIFMRFKYMQNLFYNNGEEK